MLVKLAFAMQRLKNFCHDQQRWGGGKNSYYVGDSYYEGGHRAQGRSPQSPTRENPVLCRGRGICHVMETRF